MFPEPTELLLIGCLKESIWTPKSKSNTSTPKNQLADILTKGKFHTWWVESSFVFVQHQPFQFHQLSWSDVEKNKRRWWWSTSHSKIEADDEFGLAMQRKDSWRACLCCIRKPGGKPDMKVNFLWARELSSNQEQRDLWWALAHQTTQNGTLTTSGLLRSGNLVKCWEQERRDPWVNPRSPSTQTSLSLMTMIWTLTPPQDQIFR